MSFENQVERPEQFEKDQFDRYKLENRVDRAADVNGETVRYPNAGPGTEIRTSTPIESPMKSVAEVKVYDQAGNVKDAGTAAYKVDGDAALLDAGSFRCPEGPTRGALMQEINEKAAAQGATKMQGFAANGDSGAETLWKDLGMHPAERLPHGTMWEIPVLG